MGVDAPPRPDAESATALGSGHSQPGSPRAELRGRAGPGRTPGSRTRPPGPAGGGIGREPAWAQPPWSSGRRSFGSWRGAPWGGCTGEPGGVLGMVRVRMPPFHPKAADREGEERRHPGTVWGGPPICSGFRPVSAVLPPCLIHHRSPSPSRPRTSPYLGLDFSLGLCIPPYSLDLCPPVFYFRYVSSLWVLFPTGCLSRLSD